jgi:hypothetical protein
VRLASAIMLSLDRLQPATFQWGFDLEMPAVGYPLDAPKGR